LYHRNPDVPCSARALALAIRCLAACLHLAEAIDDDVVDFIDKGGWDRLDVLLFKNAKSPAAIFEGFCTTWVWADRLGKVAKSLNVSVHFLCFLGRN
jgi:hypothetical protein